MTRRAGRTVEVIFTDRAGVRWRVYEFSVRAGAQLRAHAVGSGEGDYRGFARVDGQGERRTFSLANLKATSAIARDLERTRILSPAELQRQLDASVVWWKDERPF